MKIGVVGLVLICWSHDGFAFAPPKLTGRTLSLKLVENDKLDTVLVTKNNKELGYDGKTGRFFEIESSDSISPIKDSNPQKSTNDVKKGQLSDHVNEFVGNKMIDVPPMPYTNKSGMSISREINGVKLTSSDVVHEEKKKENKGKRTMRDAPINTAPSPTKRKNLTDRISESGAMSAAAMATAAVNAAVSMKTLTAPSSEKSYISIESTSKNVIDEDGLPLVYDKDLIESYWRKERGALNQRWSYFVSKAVPFLTRLVTLFISEGEINDRHIPELSRQARLDLQDLGPTFIKAGQMMSVRPDVLPQATLDELTKLQDAVEPFDTEIAVQLIEEELGGPLGQFFTSISESNVAAASLAQVYIATLNDGNDTKVAVKIQRPQVLSTVSKDLYVLRRAAEVFQGLVERFAPQQKTDYVALLNEWAIGFYTELDFLNEARNQKKLRDALIDAGINGVTVPKVYEELCTRRVLVSEWMDGVKLSECSPKEIAEITSIAQEAFLTQLFEFGFFHADPHPGNILKLNTPTNEGHVVALLDCGLMASIDATDQDHMISAVIHLANKDYASLVDDFIRLNILPTDCDRAAIIPLMDKALSPYIKGGGAKRYEEELKKMYGMEENSVSSQVGGFQAMTQDALTVLNDIPFSIPPYFAILGRAIVTLEGIALSGNKNYGIVMESYPFIARKLLAEDRPEIQKALQEVLFSVTDNKSPNGLKLNRLLALLNNASGSVSTKEGAAFVDLDAIPENGLSFADGVKLILSSDSESLRTLLKEEVDSIVDLLLRQITRKGMTEAIVTFSPPRPPGLPFLGEILPSPALSIDSIPLPFLLPRRNDGQIRPSLSIMTINEFTDTIAPKLSLEEEIYVAALADAAEEVMGRKMANFLRGEGLISTQTAQIVLAAATTGILGSNSILSASGVQNVLQGLLELILRLDDGTQGERNVQDILSEATSKLSSSEREVFDEIVSELTRRVLERAQSRLSIE